MSRRRDGRDGKGTARAYVDGRLFAAEGWDGVRVTVRVGSSRPVARLLESTGQEPLEGRLLGVEEALVMAREMDARRVLVFCDDEEAAGLTAETADVPAGLLGVHLRIRALMNQFQRAIIASAGPQLDALGPSALRDFSGAEVRLLGRPRNLSLFPALQG